MNDAIKVYNNVSFSIDTEHEPSTMRGIHDGPVQGELINENKIQISDYNSIGPTSVSNKQK